MKLDQFGIKLSLLIKQNTLYTKTTDHVRIGITHTGDLFIFEVLTSCDYGKCSVVICHSGVTAP